MSHTSAKQWFISGRVQGVGFRFFVERIATDLNLKGYVRNLDDGRVEVYAVGRSDRLSDLAAALHRGPRMADVRAVEEQQASVREFTGFTSH